MSSTNNLFIPDAEFEDEDELAAWIEAVKQMTLKAGDELGDEAAFIFGTLHGYGRERGLGWLAARSTARSIGLPIGRAAESLEKAAGYLKVAGNRIDAYVEAVEGRKSRRGSNFHVKGRAA